MGEKTSSKLILLFAILFVALNCWAGANWYEKSRYGLFVHYVPGLSIYPNGGTTRDINEIANKFDVKQLAADAEAFGLEYVIVTAFHAKMRPLYPSAVTEKWRPGNSAQRDCIRELIDELKPKGIKLMLYVHSTDGFEFPQHELEGTGWNDSTANFLKWNNYVAELMTEAGNRYGTDLDGFWLDMTMSADYKNMIEKPRIREALQAGNPNRVLVGNGSNLRDGMDYSSKEVYPSGALKTWKNASLQLALVVGSKADRWAWWACTKKGTWGARVTPEELYRFTVLQAASNYEGGMAWAASPYIGGGWEDGVKEMFMGCANYMKAVDGSLKGTLPSTSYPTLSNTSLDSIRNGIVATKSSDDKFEYIHVIYPPKGNNLKLPVPIDGKEFTKAKYLNSGKKIALKQNKDGITLQLPSKIMWDTVNAVIELKVKKQAKKTIAKTINNTNKSIEYKGSKWTNSLNRGRGDLYDDLAATTSNGDFCSFSFYGDNIEYIAPKGPGYGNVEVFINGISQGKFSQYNNKYLPQQIVFKSNKLGLSHHTFKVVKLDGAYMQVDGFNVYEQ